MAPTTSTIELDVTDTIYVVFAVDGKTYTKGFRTTHDATIRVDHRGLNNRVVITETPRGLELLFLVLTTSGMLGVLIWAAVVGQLQGASLITTCIVTYYATRTCGPTANVWQEQPATERTGLCV